MNPTHKYFLRSASYVQHKLAYVRILRNIIIILLSTAIFNVQSQEVVPSKTIALWEAYLVRFFQADGRILDSGINPNTTSSEAQTYTLFMSLVTNDRLRFDIILNWIEAQLAQKSLRRNLPGWNWGKRSDGEWTLLDDNSASDADLWLAYTLFQAGMLWNEPRYTNIAYAVLSQIKHAEMSKLPGFGKMLVPAPKGFKEHNKWRINPSYLPLQLFRYFQTVDPSGPWAEFSVNTIRLFQTFPRHLAPDWAIYRNQEGWTYKENQWLYGSYDAIRTYLWAGMLNQSDPAKTQLLDSLSGMLQVLKITQVPPHKINIVTGDFETGAPTGFSAAIMPFLKSQNEKEMLHMQLQAIDEKFKNKLIGENPRYYDQILSLFGLGWYEGYFSFNLDGSLKTAWHQ